MKTAVFWIRDGVLIDRMHVNAVSFAVASLTYAAPRLRAKVSLTELANFAFANSGISCAEKMHKLNETEALLPDVTAASSYYNALATEAASHCRYFIGICDLVKQLNETGVLNFITSAVEQPVLDAWAASPQGREVTPYLVEILGRRGDFSKGRDHFAYVREQFGVERIFYVADAVAEIENGAQWSRQFNILPVGFANVLTPQNVAIAHELVLNAAHSRMLPASASTAAAVDLSCGEIELPDEKELVAMLKNANAVHVVSGDSTEIVRDLSSYFALVKVLL